jgi:hypothetical protein
MKRCPQCSRTFTNDAQKFCTQDGVSLIDDAAPASPRASQGETIRIEAARPETPEFDDETTKQISRGLKPEASGEFDPYKTLVSKPQDTSTKVPVDTGGLKPSSTTPPSAPAPTSALNPSTSDLMKTMASYNPPVQQRPASKPQPPPPQKEPAVQPSQPLPQSPAPPLPMRSSAELPKTVPAPAKKSKLPIVLGILAVLLFLALGGAVAGYFFVLRPMLEARRETPEATPTPAATPVATPKTQEKTEEVKEPPPYSPPPNGVQFVSSSENLSGRLKEHYVGFSFYYPQSWLKDPTAGVGNASNFAKVERRLPPDFTQENFAVGSYVSAGSPEGDRAIFPTVARKLSAQYEKTFDPYKKVSEGPVQLGVYNGYEFRFESFSPNTEKGDIKIWGRVIFLPPVDGSRNGVTLLMLATSLASELKSVDDVGVKGELPMMLESFRFGRQNR